jgi:hypothetical protein
MMVLRTLLMMPSAMAFLRELALLVQLAAMASWMPVSTISSVSDSEPRLPSFSGVGLDVGVDEVAHVRLVGLDVQLLARVLLDRRADVAVELDLLFAAQPSASL